MKSQRSSRRFVAELIQKLWDMWNHRNQLIVKGSSPELTVAMEKLQLHTYYHHTRVHNGIHRCSQHLVKMKLSIILGGPIRTQMQWMKAVVSSRLN
eukprot:8883524-Ditylum_brightwellii.AAC.1